MAIAATASTAPAAQPPRRDAASGAQTRSVVASPDRGAHSPAAHAGVTQRSPARRAAQSSNRHVGGVAEAAASSRARAGPSGGTQTTQGRTRLAHASSHEPASRCQHARQPMASLSLHPSRSRTVHTPGLHASVVHAPPAVTPSHPRTFAGAMSARASFGTRRAESATAKSAACREAGVTPAR